MTLSSRDRMVVGEVVAQRDLHAEGEAVAFALSSHAVGLYYQDFATGEHVWCPVAKEVFGVGPDFEVDVEKFMALVHPDDRGPLIDSVAQVHDPDSKQAEYCVEYRIVVKGSIRWLCVKARVARNAEGHVVRELGNVRDISRERELAEALATAQRRHDLGRLTGAIAHDFNNFLTSMLGEAALSSTVEGVPEEVRRSLTAIETAVERASVLTRQLLSYSRQQIMDARPAELGAAMSQVERLVRRVISADVSLSFRGTDVTWPVRIDLTQLQQVLMNLVLNACHASRPGARIEVDVQRRNVVEGGPLPRGAYAVVRVRDWGMGMSSDHLAQVFEPFYTTKPSGTGLGLPTCRSIARSLGGDLVLESTLGEGTTAHLFLPILSKESWYELKREVPQPVAARGTLRRLVLAEDEPHLRDLLVRGLLGLNFAVEAVESGDQLLTRVEQSPGTLDLVVTDVIMPGMPIAQLRQRLLDIEPKLPVLFMSGYPSHDAAGHNLSQLLRPHDGFIQKPFTIVSLAQRVRQLLASRDSD